MMCFELCPPSAESRSPGSPADSQLKQISMFSQIAQWNRAPTISSMQLRAQSATGVQQPTLKLNVLRAFNAMAQRCGHTSVRALRKDRARGAHMARLQGGPAR
jgi:hypothetical protein